MKMISTLQNIQQKPMNQTLIFDLESTGLLRRGSKIHCIVARDVDELKEPFIFDNNSDNSIDMGVERLRRADVLIGHNIIGYDVPLIKEKYDFEFNGEVIDTLVLSRLFYPHILDRDYERRPEGMPQKLYGRHSLEAWGYRLKCYKGDYSKQTNAWDIYTPEMLEYCIQDTLVTLKVYELMIRRMEDYA